MKKQVGAVYAFQIFNRMTRTENRIANGNIKGKHL